MAERMVMPCVPLRGLSVFPHTILHFDIGREKSVKALEAAMTADKQLFLTSQKDENILIPTPEDYYAVGTVVKIKQMLKIQGDAVRVLVEGQYRAVMSGIATEEPYIMAEITEAEIVPADPQEIEVQALMRSVLYAFDRLHGAESGDQGRGLRTDQRDRRAGHLCRYGGHADGQQGHSQAGGPGGSSMSKSSVWRLVDRQICNGGKPGAGASSATISERVQESSQAESEGIYSAASR